MLRGNSGRHRLFLRGYSPGGSRAIGFFDWNGIAKTEILAISTEKLRLIGLRQVGDLVSLACVSKLYAPNGSVALPGPGLSGEVTEIDQKSGSEKRAVPECTVPEHAALERAARLGADPEHSGGADGGGGALQPDAQATDPSEALIGTTERPRWAFYHLARTMVAETYRRGVEIELMHRAIGFAALGFVTLVPLLIVVAAAAPLNGRTFPQWAVAGLGLSGQAASAVNTLFGSSAQVLSTTTALSLAGLAVFGLSFVSVVQTGLARVWELPAARLLSVWRQAVWLAVLVGLLLVGADLVALLHDGLVITTLRWCATAAGSTLFFWWTPRFLLESRVPWRALLPGAVLTVIGLIGLRLFSAVIFSPLIVSSAITYGAIGAVLILVSWLIGTGFVIFGAGLLGRAVYEAWGGGDE
jgi:membrane protein